MDDTRKRIVLIDDDSTTNYLNKMIIERSQLVDEVLTFDTANDALDYFKTKVEADEGSLVLLDINMPIMNGWQFMDQYIALNGKLKANKVVMLTSSIDPSDKQQAEENLSVAEFKSKPLSVEMVGELVTDYWT